MRRFSLSFDLWRKAEREDNYEVQEGEFGKQINKISTGYAEHLNLKHYVVITQNYNIDIVTEWEPAILCTIVEDDDMYNELYDLIMKVDFKQAEKVFIEMSEREQMEVIERLAYKTESMIIYSFVQYVNSKDEKILFHEMEFDMLTNALSHIEGAYQIALYHNQRLLELVPDSTKYMEWMLSFYDVKVIDKEKAVHMAKKILNNDLNNTAAQSMLARLL